MGDGQPTLYTVLALLFCNLGSSFGIVLPADNNVCILVNEQADDQHFSVIFTEPIVFYHISLGESFASQTWPGIFKEAIEILSEMQLMSRRL